MRGSVVLTALCCATITASSTRAQSDPVLYELGVASHLTEGCYPPCHCPLFFVDDLSGTFELRFLSSTPDGFAHYAVENVDWSITYEDETRHVSGAGTFDLGGEVALMQRLRLQLSLDGGPPERYDSGLEVGGFSFPLIDVAVSMNGMVCYDRVFDLHAAPLSIGTSYCSSAPNSTGQRATIRATGSAAVTDNDVTLIAESLPPTEFGVFFFGLEQDQAPFGDGFLCVAGSLYRLPPALSTDPAGNVVRTLDLASPPGDSLTVGSTGYFQFWYRDPDAGGAGFNLTDGASVMFR